MTERVFDRSIFKRLESSNITEVYNALVKLRTSYLNGNVAIQEFKKNSAMKIMVPFIENPKLASTALSIIGNCALDSGLRCELLTTDCIERLIRILRGLTCDTLQNRACRSLGNLSLSDQGCSSVHKQKGVPLIVKLLTSSEDKGCQQTAIRTLRILGTGVSNCQMVTMDRGIFAVSKFLHSDDETLLLCSVKALSSLTKKCSIDCAKQLQEADGLKALVKLASHSNKSVRDFAITCLENLAGQSAIRPELGNAGVVPIFIEIASSPASYKDVRSAILALCYCCKESINRIRVRESNGFKMLLEVLKDYTYKEIHENIIVCLLCFRYDQQSLDVLLDMELIHILTRLLQKYVDDSERGTNHDILKTPDKPKRYKDCSKEECVPVKSDDIFIFQNVEIDCVFPRKNVEVLYSDTRSLSPTDLECETEALNSVPTSQSSFTFSIHSPSYQGIQNTDTSTSQYSAPGTAYHNFFSSTSAFSVYSSPDHYSVDYSVNSPSSVSSGTFSPTSSVPLSPASNAPLSPSLTDPISPASSPPFSPASNGLFSAVDELLCPTSDGSFSLNSAKVLLSNPEQSKWQIQMAERARLLSDNRGGVEDITDLLFNSDVASDDLHGVNHSEAKAILKSCQSEMMDIQSKKNYGFRFCLKRKFEKSAEGNNVTHYIISLLSYLSKVLKTNLRLAEEACIIALMEYFILLPQPDLKVHRIFQRLINNYNCFDKLIRMNFFGKLDRKIRTPHNLLACDYCSTLNELKNKILLGGSIVAESDFGIGALSHILLTGSKIAQLNSIYAFSMLVKQKTLLQKLLIDSDGLSCLLEFLSGSIERVFKEDLNERVFKDVSLSLSRIYHSLNKEPRKCTTAIYLNELNVEKTCIYEACAHDVTFILDCGANIKGSRTVLCENSAYFEALLSGYYIESGENIIKLSEISKKSLLIIFHHLHGCYGALCLSSIDFTVLLELLQVCDKFLLLNLKAIIEKQLIKKMKMGWVPKVYMVSKVYNAPALAKQALHFTLLATEVEKEEFFSCLRKLLKLPNIDALDDIKHCIKIKFPGCREHPLYNRSLSVEKT